MESPAVNVDGVIVLGSCCSDMLTVSGPQGWISSSGIRVLLRRHEVGKRGPCVQHLVTRSIKARRKTAKVTRTVVRITVR